MYLSGFTFWRNLVRLDYPFLESIQSLLPIVDELVVAVGNSDDGTRESVEELRSKNQKIKIIDTVWDRALFEDGKIFAQQTNLALENVSPHSDWAIHLQADEVLHEKDYGRFVSSLERYKDEERVLCLMLRQKYFYGDYWHTNPYAGRRLLRIVRPGGILESVGDSSGFARKSDGIYIGKSQRQLWEYAEGDLFHYGYVNIPEKLKGKIRAKADLYHQGQLPAHDEKRVGDNDYQPELMEIMRPFRGTHPAVMDRRVTEFPIRYHLRNRWLNPAFYRYVLRHGYKG